jgi:hypothetical protein
MPTKLYAIKDSHEYFRAGVSPTDRAQGLFGRQGNRLVCVKFLADGRFVCADDKLLSDPHGDSVVFAEIEDWMEQLGFAPDTIHIQKFALPDRAIEIKDTPDYLQEFIDSPSLFSGRDEELSRCVDEWRKQGGYVLIWDEEYEMTADGEVEST